jgi:hypothetical protein
VDLIWENDLWRLETDEAAGVSHLEPRRHVAYVGDLDAREAAAFGTVLAHCSRALQLESGAERVDVRIGEAEGRLRVELAHPGAGAGFAARLRKRLEQDPPPEGERELPTVLPYPVPVPRRVEPGDPEIPPLRPEPPDEPWPDRPAHDPWF